jgi:hypothetical protein
MTFTRVLVQLKRREKQCIGSKLYSTEKLNKKMVKKATKSDQQGIYSSKR